MRYRFLRHMIFAIFLCIAEGAIGGQATAQESYPPEWRAPAAEIVVWFETSGAGWGQVTGDFDGQGVSAGVLQWNVGRSSLWEDILEPVPEQIFVQTMPTYGADFRRALSQGSAAGLDYVRGLQTYRDASSHDGNKRGARWTADGKVFARELSALMASDPVRERQSLKLEHQLRNGWDYARWWAEARRGADAQPTFREFAFFTDTLNFNGRWTRQANYALVQRLKAGKSNKEVLSEITDYLNSDISGQLQVPEARRNAELWSALDPNDEQIDLLVFSYLIAKDLNKPSARQFRFNTISRRGAIIFNDGWVNGERKSFGTALLN